MLKHQHATSSGHLSSDTRELPVESPGSQTSSSLSAMDSLFMLMVLVQLEQRKEGWVEKLEFLSCSALPEICGCLLQVVL